MLVVMMKLRISKQMVPLFQWPDNKESGVLPKYLFLPSIYRSRRYRRTCGSIMAGDFKQVRVMTLLAVSDEGSAMLYTSQIGARFQSVAVRGE